jgi:beta-adrenergic-receptor kinase
MEQIEDVNTELQQVKNEQSIIVRTKDLRIVLTNSDEIALREWSVQLSKTLRDSKELLAGLRKAGKIYGTRDGNMPNN